MRERPPHATSAPEGITSDSARKRQRLDKVISRVEGSLAGEQDEVGGSDNFMHLYLMQMQRSDDRCAEERHLEEERRRELCFAHAM